MQVNTARAAWLQGVAVVLAAALLAAVLLQARQRPFDRDTLAIPLGQLRSQAAEASLLAAQVRGDRLAPGFVRRHARQLAGNVARGRRALAARPVPAPLAAPQAQARRLGAVLEDALGALARDGHAPRGRDLGFDGLGRRLDALHARWKPGG